MFFNWKYITTKINKSKKRPINNHSKAIKNLTISNLKIMEKQHHKKVSNFGMNFYGM